MVEAAAVVVSPDIGNVLGGNRGKGRCLSLRIEGVKG